MKRIIMLMFVLIIAGSICFARDRKIARDNIINACAPISNLGNWYWECRGRNLKYGGIHDRNIESAPVSRSSNMFIKLGVYMYPGQKKEKISNSLKHSLVSQTLSPTETGHKRNTERLHILTIGDSNGTFPYSWPQQVKKLLPFSTVVNRSISGNTIGFDNLGSEELNTLKNINRYLDEAYTELGADQNFDYIVINLGTNDAKRIFEKRQKEVPENMKQLIEMIRQYMTSHHKVLPQICIVTPSPMDEQKVNAEKYGGGDRVQENNKLFQKLAKYNPISNPTNRRSMVNRNQIVIFGADKIGRSFIGQLFGCSGYRVVFVDVDPVIIAGLNEKGSYRVVIKGDKDQEIFVPNVSAISALDRDKVVEAVSTAGILVVSVGNNVFERIVPVIAAGVEKRHTTDPGTPLDIILAENMRSADEFVCEILIQNLSSGFAVDELVGLVETSIGKMVPIIPQAELEKDTVAVFDESYNTLIFDRRWFKSAIPEIKGLTPNTTSMPGLAEKRSFITWGMPLRLITGIFSIRNRCIYTRFYKTVKYYYLHGRLCFNLLLF